MAEFKIGDRVVRKENIRHGGWELECARNDKATDDIFQVEGLLPLTGRVTLVGLPVAWDESSFRLATSLEEHQGTGLPAEDRLRESDAHIECLRELLDIERRKVDELQAEIARCCGTVANKAVMEDKIAKLLSLNNDLSDHVSDLIGQLHDVTDQRDAAVLTAKALGEDLRVARKEARWARFAKRHLSGLCDALFAATADIDLHHVATQLYLLAQMCEEQGNGADATLAYNAAQVVELTAMTLASLDEVQEYVPRHFPPMEGPLA